MKLQTLGLFVVLLLGWLQPALADRPWYHTAHSGKPFVNPDLTPTRVVGQSVDAAWEGQLVLWQGRIQHMTHGGRDNRETTLALEVGNATVTVHYRAPALNLEHDRTGYRVAVKGTLQLHDHRLVGLDGKSLILLAPPNDQGYASYLQASGKTNGDLVSFLSWWIGFHNPTYAPALREQIASAIQRNAQLNHLDPLLLASLIQIESAFRVDVVSRSGAIGLGQLMPFTARGFGVDPWNPQDNVKASARMISGLIRAFASSSAGAHQSPLALALASYNAGPNRVRSCGGVPAIPQTTNYVYFIGYVHDEMSAAAQRCGVLR